MQFTKMHGAGNDYIYIDCFAQPIPQDPEQLACTMADRHYGVGGDGLILICPTDKANAEMRMYNADGTPAGMCGNGIRCVAKYLYDHGIASQDRLSILSAGILYTLDVISQDGKVDRIQVDMNEPVLEADKIPTTLAGNPVINVPLDIGGRVIRVTCLSMGNPHCVVFVDEITDDLVWKVGPAIENHKHFPQRTNVEFAKIYSRQEMYQRTWERGSGETLACGSGASAVCVAGVLNGRTDRKVRIHLQGGDLEIEWRESNNHVYMTGPAVEVFTGEWPAENE